MNIVIRKKQNTLLEREAECSGLKAVNVQSANKQFLYLVLYEPSLNSVD